MRMRHGVMHKQRIGMATFHSVTCIGVSVCMSMMA